MADPISLYWWKGVPNFGDAISATVVAHVSGRSVAHAGPGRAELIAIGSLMHVVRKNYADGRSHRPILWGTGQLGHVNRDFLRHVDIALLRGPLSASLLGFEHDHFGDPGLLVADALGARLERGDHVGIVPHHTLQNDPELHALVAREPRLRLIDVAGDAAEVCRQIGSCAHVVSSSLHGLIVADAYGVPSTWLDPVGQNRFKYHDYAASVGRPLRLPFTLEDIGKTLGSLPDGPLPWQDGIDACKGALNETFPAHLRADQTLAATA